MAKTLKEMIALGHVTVSYEDTSGDIRITRRRYDDQTGDEVAPQIEHISRAEVEYYIEMRQQQLEDLQELLKVIPKE